jgi:hypothetical protein
MPQARAEKSRTQLRVEIPTEIAEHYQSIADDSRKSIETILADRLETTAEYYDTNPGRPLFFNNAERQELEQLLAKNVFSTRDALVLIRNALSLRLGSQKITLRPELLSRLKSRCINMDWEQFLELTTIQQLERFVGLR